MAAARLRHPLHLGDHLFRIGDDRDHESGDRVVEAVVVERHVLRVHLDEVHVVELLLSFFFWAFSSIFLVTSIPTISQPLG